MTLYGSLYRRVLFPAFDGLIKRRQTCHYWREAESSQWLGREQLENRQLLDLQAMVSYAWEHCRYYREAWSSLGLDPTALSTIRDFHRWPILTREAVRTHRLQVQSDAVPRRLTKTTGGSTGEPLVFDLDTQSNERRTAMTFRGYDWARGGPGAKRLLLWGVDLKKTTRWRKLKVALHHAFDHEMVLNCFDLSAATMPIHFRTMERFRPEVIIAYTNAIYEFARFLKENALVPTGIRSIIVGAEKIYPFQRELIEQVFQAPVFETYGSREFMLIGAECDRHSGLHLSMENLLVEVLDEDGRPTPDGEEGDVVVTDLFNHAMPFIRYRNGDRAIAGFEMCPCGRGLPLLKQVVGRKLDVIKTRSGKIIPGEYFPHFLKDFPVIRRFQVLQDSLDAIKIQYVSDGNLVEATESHIRQKVRETLGSEIAVSMKQVDEIPLTRSGKLQVVVSHIAIS